MTLYGTTKLIHLYHHPEFVIIHVGLHLLSRLVFQTSFNLSHCHLYHYPLLLYSFMSGLRLTRSTNPFQFSTQIALVSHHSDFMDFETEIPPTHAQ